MLKPYPKTDNEDPFRKMVLDFEASVQREIEGLLVPPHATDEAERAASADTPTEEPR